MMNQPPKEFTVNLINKDHTALYLSACTNASLKSTFNYNFDLYVRHVSISHGSSTSHIYIHLSWFHPVSQCMKTFKIFHACISICSFPPTSFSIQTHAIYIPHALIPISKKPSLNEIKGQLLCCSAPNTTRNVSPGICQVPPRVRKKEKKGKEKKIGRDCGFSSFMVSVVQRREEGRKEKSELMQYVVGNARIYLSCCLKNL